MKKLIFFLISYLFLTTSALAKHCSVNFNYGIVINPKNIRMLEKGITYVQINNNKQLFIHGREITLNNEQQDLLKQYSLGIRQQLPEIVSIAIEGVDIGLKAVNKVIASLTGENSASHQKIQEKFEKIKWRIRARFNHSAENYYLAPQDLDNFDELFTGEFEQAIEEIVSESIGTILMTVGDVILQANNEELLTDNSEQRVTTFDERMQNMGQDIKLEINSKVTRLEEKSERFCHNLVALDKIETELQQSILPLKNYNLIEANDN